jgi:hypothetical protein
VTEELLRLRPDLSARLDRDHHLHGSGEE